MSPIKATVLQQRISGKDVKRKAALKFVLAIGVVSLFADFTYEGSRSITGPFLQILGASGTIVGIVAGLGQLLGYGLRFFSGRISERTGEFWPITFFGYIVQMSAVPLLALAGNWRIAALLILLERVGKAIRNPPRDVMLSHAAKEMGFGWGFGVHEALDQCGALFGPLLIALILAHRGDYRLAFGTLAVPAGMTLLLLSIARMLYPRPEDLEAKATSVQAKELPHTFWVYLAAAALVSVGFADFQLIAFHFQKDAVVKTTWIPIFYSVAMAVSGAGSLAIGRLFDRFGISVLIPLTVLSHSSRHWSSLAASGRPSSASHFGGWAWVFMNQLSPRQLPRWFLWNAGPPLMVCSPERMDCPGLLAVPLSESCMTILCRRSSLSA